MISYPSPNFGDRPIAPDTVILHYTGMQSAKQSLARLCDPAAEVSAHYLIDEQGACFQLVHPDKRAWHAGVSHWAGRDNANDWSIGIELQNPGHEFGYRPFPKAQIDQLLALLDQLRSDFSIPQHNYIGHSDVAPLRKQDPGALFPWNALFEEGFGVMPNPEATAVSEKSMSFVDTKEQLTAIGYLIEDETSHTAALTAFKAHFMAVEDHKAELTDEVAACLNAVRKAFASARAPS